MMDRNLKIVGEENTLRLLSEEQKKLDSNLSKNGFDPIKVVDSESHMEAEVLGLSDYSAEFLLNRLTNADKVAEVIPLVNREQRDSDNEH